VNDNNSTNHTHHVFCKDQDGKIEVFKTSETPKGIIPNFDPFKNYSGHIVIHIEDFQSIGSELELSLGLIPPKHWTGLKWFIRQSRIEGSGDVCFWWEYDSGNKVKMPWEL